MKERQKKWKREIIWFFFSLSLSLSLSAQTTGIQNWKETKRGERGRGGGRIEWESSKREIYNFCLDFLENPPLFYFNFFPCADSSFGKEIFRARELRKINYILNFICLSGLTFFRETTRGGGVKNPRKWNNLSGLIRLRNKNLNVEFKEIYKTKISKVSNSFSNFPCNPIPPFLFSCLSAEWIRSRQGSTGTGFDLSRQVE